MLKSVFCLSFLVSVASACALCGGSLASLINVSTHTLFTNNAIQKIEVVWKFDETLSAQLISLYDTNKNARFEEEETHAMFDILEKAEKPHFMSIITLNDIPMQAFTVKNFTAEINNKMVQYAFDIELNAPIKDASKLVYYFFDSTRSLAFFHTPENITFDNKTDFTISKSFGFKILQNTMSVVNTISYEIKK
ncbi:DUF1007 family protein [Sulfurospirillum sp.]|uniref:DUF1007 family protein n=1 Tax=Sulfurospirillum sp. TaxID=2053622 RepID=UPI002FDED33A